jgi:hypothetical protein
VIEIRVLRRIFGLKKRLRTLKNEELHNLYSSPNISKVMKSSRTRLAGLVARMGERSMKGFSGKAVRKETTRKI